MVVISIILAALSQEALFSFLGIFVTQAVILVIALHNGSQARSAVRNAETAASHSEQTLSQVVENHGASLKDAVNRIENAGYSRDAKLQAIAEEFTRFAESSISDRADLRAELIRVARESRQDRQVIWEAIANQDRIGLLMKNAKEDRVS